jgi:hypothetical protein
MRRVNFERVYQFLNYYLGQRVGKNGRAKRKVRSRQSLVTFWCCFRLAFQRATYYKIDAHIDRDLMFNVRQHANSRPQPGHPSSPLLRSHIGSCETV